MPVLHIGPQHKQTQIRISPPETADSGGIVGSLYLNGDKLAFDTSSSLPLLASIMFFASPVSQRWLLLLPPQKRLVINEDWVFGLHIFSHNDTVSIVSNNMQFEDDFDQQVVEAGDPLLRQRDPYVQKLFAVGDVAVKCPGCLTIYRKDSWLEKQRCATKGCQYRIVNRVSDL